MLVYHQIRTEGAAPEDGDTAIGLDRFTAQMEWLAGHGYVPLSMDDSVRYLQGLLPPLAGPPVAIHLDDGWKSGLAALPVLERFRFKATYWVIAGTGIGLPHVDWADVVALEAHPLIDVQSHTLTHPWKPGETLVDWVTGRTMLRGTADAAHELQESKRLLESRLGRAVPYLAWPSGHYNDALIALAQQAGYTALLTIDDGVNVPGTTDLLRIRRTMIHGGCDITTFSRILQDGVFRTCPAATR